MRHLVLLALLALTAAQAAGPESVTLPSGVAVQTYRQGDGSRSPTLADVVRVHYQGTLADGKAFDSSYDRGQPAELPLEALIPCWQEVLQQMSPGGAVRIVCPPETAYGSRGVAGKIPPDSTLTFVIELLEVKR
ncbi:MAG TPA: FKBP-type peptidyl-prolyl cis-trans isomerase [Thauera sp.]|nr:FKBP-type peptidyl-prolyl cis-trans isomerase [Thauera sp.]